MKENELLNFTRNFFLIRQRINEKIGSEFGLTPTDIDILIFIYVWEGEVTATNIERECYIKKNTISVHIDNLVKMGYIQRKENKDDRRVINLFLTDKAITVVKKSIAKNKEMRAKLLAGLTEEDRTILHKCFEVITKNANNLNK